MGQTRATVLMACVVVARSVSLLFSKTALLELDPFNLLGIRFLLAFICLSLLFSSHVRSLSKRGIMHGMVMGTILAALMTVEMHALLLAPTTVVSFLENTAVVFVPVFSMLLLRRRPTLLVVVSATMAFIGVGFLTLGGTGISGFGAGEGLALVVACLYSALIIVTSRFAGIDDPLGIGTVQLGVAGALCMGMSAIFEQPRLPVCPETWASLSMLVIICSVFGFAFQPVAQRFISAERAGTICALSPVSAMILGITFGNEALSMFDFVGAGVVLCSLLLSVRVKPQAVDRGKRSVPRFE